MHIYTEYDFFPFMLIFTLLILSQEKYENVKLKLVISMYSKIRKYAMLQLQLESYQ